MLEKDREQLDEKSRNLRFQGEKSSRFASDLTNSNKDDFKRAKKTKRDLPSPIPEQSPLANLYGCNDTSWATPVDDRVKDPDYDPTQTPSVWLGNKTSKGQKTIPKRMKKSNSNSEIELRNLRNLSFQRFRSSTTPNQIELNNDENKV